MMDMWKQGKEKEQKSEEGKGTEKDVVYDAAEFTGQFEVTLPFSQFVARLKQEGGGVAHPPHIADPAQTSSETGADSGTGTVGSAPAAPSAEAHAAELQQKVEDALTLNYKLKKAPHPNLPYLTADSSPILIHPNPKHKFSSNNSSTTDNSSNPNPVPESESYSLRSAKELSAMPLLEKLEYEKLLLKGFLHLDDQVRATLTEEQEREYSRARGIAASAKKRLLQEADPAYCLAHPPADCRGQKWLLDLQVRLSCLLRLSKL